MEGFGSCHSFLPLGPPSAPGMSYDSRRRRAARKQRICIAGLAAVRSSDDLSHQTGERIEGSGSSKKRGGLSASTGLIRGEWEFRRPYSVDTFRSRAIRSTDASWIIGYRIQVPEPRVDAGLSSSFFLSCSSLPFHDCRCGAQRNPVRFQARRWWISLWVDWWISFCVHLFQKASVDGAEFPGQFSLGSSGFTSAQP